LRWICRFDGSIFIVVIFLLKKVVGLKNPFFTLSRPRSISSQSDVTINVLVLIGQLIDEIDSVMTSKNTALLEI